MNLKYKYSIFILCFLVFIFAGCAKEQVPSTRQARLVASENLELKEQIKKLNAQIEELEKLYLESQKEIENLKETSQQNVRQQVQDVLDNVLEQNAQLRKENEQLETWLETQRTQIAELERMLSEASK